MNVMKKINQYTYCLIHVLLKERDNYIQELKEINSMERERSVKLKKQLDEKRNAIKKLKGG